MDDKNKPACPGNEFPGVDIDAAHAAAPVPPVPAPAEQHSDDLAVDRFATAMKAKMAKQRAKGYGGWDQVAACTDKSLADKLMGHTKKGDPVDVANFCMMLHQRNQDQVDFAIGTLRGASLDFAKRVASMWIPSADAGAIRVALADQADRANDNAVEFRRDRAKEGTALEQITDRVLAALPVARQDQAAPVAEVDAGEDGLFIDIIYGEDGSPLKVGDKLYLAAPVAQEGEPGSVQAAPVDNHPLDGLHINQGSMDAASDAYFMEWQKSKCRNAYENRYHKVAALCPYDEWEAAWFKAIAAAQAAPAEQRDARLTLERNPSPPVIGNLCLRDLLAITVNPGAGGAYIPLAKWLPVLLGALWDESDGVMRGKAVTFGKDLRTLKADVIRSLVRAGLVRGQVDIEDYVRHYDHEQASVVIRAIVEAALRSTSTQSSEGAAS